jgi:hypothetical protein
MLVKKRAAASEVQQGRASEQRQAVSQTVPIEREVRNMHVLQSEVLGHLHLSVSA